MRHHRPSRSRRRPALAVLAVLVAAVTAPLVGAGPAAASPAPLLTADGVGIRLDETALTEILEDVENELQVLVDPILWDGAFNDYSGLTSSPAFVNLFATGDVELTLDFLLPTPGAPDGALALDADIVNMELEYRLDAWWHTECGVWVVPDPPTTVTADATVDPSLLPGTPFAVTSGAPTWSANPPTESTSGVCWTYIPSSSFDWTSFTDTANPASAASLLQDEVDLALSDLLDEIWTNNVAAVFDSLANQTGLGVTVNQLHTDDNGLIVTADTEASGGITIPAIGGPYNVAAAEDAGVTTNINTLLANRTTIVGPSDVIVSVHPNVTNQYLEAFTTAVSGDLGSSAVNGTAIENVLLNPPARPAYANNGWTARLRVTTSPASYPTGAGGRPQVTLPTMSLAFHNTSYVGGILPVATFSGSMGAIDGITLLDPAASLWVPGHSATNATLGVTRTQANPDAAAVPPQSSGAIRPYARNAFAAFSANVFIPYIGVPITMRNHPVALCTTCPRYTGDQRYTETYHVS